MISSLCNNINPSHMEINPLKMACSLARLPVRWGLFLKENGAGWWWVGGSSTHTHRVFSPPTESNCQRTVYRVLSVQCTECSAYSAQRTVYRVLSVQCTQCSAYSVQSAQRTVYTVLRRGMLRPEAPSCCHSHSRYKILKTTHVYIFLRVATETTKSSSPLLRLLPFIRQKNLSRLCGFQNTTLWL